MEKCPHCKAEYKKKPLKNLDGTWNWKNILIPDKEVIIYTVIILIMLFAHKSAVGHYEELVSDPTEFCESYGFVVTENNYNPYVTEDSQINIKGNWST